MNAVKLHPETLNLYKICKLYWGSLLIGFACWVVDQKFCDLLYSLPFGIPNPQLHAWWHLAVGMNMHCGTQFIIAIRFKYLSRGVLPTVKIRAGGLIPEVTDGKHRM